MEKFETIKHDVLVIGSGGAGLRAAIEASASGASVGVVCRSLLGKAHTVMCVYRRIARVSWPFPFTLSF